MNQYKFLNQFYKDANINIDEIILKEIEVNACNSVDIFIAEKRRGVVTITKAYSISCDEPVRSKDINKIIMSKSKLDKIYSCLK